MRLLVVDNFDSFTYNLVQYAAEAGADPLVRRNDQLTVEAALGLAPDAIIVSPGPGTPRDAGVSLPLIVAAAGRIPLLGVCLGHQAIAEAFGATVSRARRPMHGRTTAVVHGGTGLFRGLPTPLTVMRYHSLVVVPETLPGTLEATAWSVEAAGGDEIMALQHRTAPVFGVQFHPESIGTEGGRAMVGNFLALAADGGAHGPSEPLQ